MTFHELSKRISMTTCQHTVGWEINVPFQHKK